jgi:spermidine/putrescine transport system permease protein
MAIAMAMAIAAFLYAPIAMVVVHSFNASKRGGPWAGFTLEWYRRLGESPEKISALTHTLILAVLSTLIATVLGTALGYALSRFRFPGRRLVVWLMYLPVVIPDVVMAIALLMAYSMVRDWMGGFQLGLGTMIVAHVTFQIPFVALVVRSRLAGLDPAVEEAAHDLGATPWQKFRHVTLPLAWPGVFAGAALAFTLSVDDFVVSFFTSGPGSATLPILIYASVKRGITPDVHALSSLIVLVSVIGTVIAARAGGRTRGRGEG